LLSSSLLALRFRLGQPAPRPASAGGRPSQFPRELALHNSLHARRLPLYARGFVNRRQTQPWLVASRRRPLPLRVVAARSSQRYCLAMVAHLVRPNYSFNATVQSLSQNSAPGAAR